MGLVVSCSQNTVTNTRCLGVFASSFRKILEPQSASQVSYECPRPSHHKDSRIWTMFCLVSSWAGVLRSTVQFQKKNPPGNRAMSKSARGAIPCLEPGPKM
jgi:hypothetical protein